MHNVSYRVMVSLQQSKITSQNNMHKQYVDNTAHFVLCD